MRHKTSFVAKNNTAVTMLHVDSTPAAYSAFRLPSIQSFSSLRYPFFRKGKIVWRVVSSGLLRLSLVVLLLLLLLLLKFVFVVVAVPVTTVSVAGSNDNDGHEEANIVDNDSAE